MATVRSPSSFAARKIRMAISLRLAASNFWIGLVFFITVAKMCCAKFYIVSQTRRGADAVFSMNGTSYFHELSRERDWRLRASELTYGDRGFPRRVHAGGHRRRRFQLLQLDLDFPPGLGVALCFIGCGRICKELHEFCLYFRRDAKKTLLRKLVQQLGVRFVIQTVFSGTGALADVEIVVWQI